MTKITSKTVRGRSADELNSKDSTKYIWTESGLGANTFIVDKDTVSSALNLTGLTGDVINIDGYSGDYTARLTNSILTLQTNDQTITVSLAKNSIITLQFTDSSKEVDLKNKTLNLVDIDGKTLYSQSLATKSGVLHIDGFTSYQALHQDSLIATAVKTALTDIKNINYKTIDAAIISNDDFVRGLATTVALTDTSGIKYNNLTDFKKLILTDTAKNSYPTVDIAILSNDVTVINATVEKRTGFLTLDDFVTAYNKLLNPLPTFSVTGSSQVTEGNNAKFLVNLANQGSSGSYTVNAALSAIGSADKSADFGVLTLVDSDGSLNKLGVTLDASGKLTIPASANISDVTLTTLVTPDVFIEKGEKLSLTLSPANSNAAVSTTKNTVTTDINDPQILPSFDVTPGGQVKEGDLAIFKIILSNLSSTSEYSVNTTLLGTDGATIGTDFVGTLELSKTSKDAGILFNPTSGLLTIPKNVNITTVELQTRVNTDLEAENGEKLSLTLSLPSSNAVLGNQTSKIAITESNPPTFTIKALNEKAQVEEKSIAKFKIDLKDYKSTDEYTVNIKVDGINVEHELNPLTKPINANTSIANTTVNPLTLELNASLPGLIDFVDETKLTTQSLDDDSIKAGVTLNAGVLKIPANTGTSSVVLSIPILPDQVTLEKDEGIKLTLSLPTPTPTNYIVGDASTALMTIIDISDISPVLTSGADILFGTYGDTSFTSELLTLNAGDSVIDSSTTDKDKIKITTNFPLFTATATPTITNIETINLTALNNLDMDMTKITGVQNFNSINSTATIKLTKIADAKMALGLSGSNINTINANYSSIAAPTATADKLTVNLDAAIDANVTVNSGFEYAELNVVNDSTLRLFDVQLKPITGILTISGTGKLTVWDNALEVLGATPNGVNNIELINTSRMQFGDIGTLVVSGTPPVQSAIQTALLSTFKAPTNTGGIVTGTVQGALKGLTMQLGNGPDNVTIVDNATAPIQASPVPAFNDIRLGADDDKLDFTRSSNGNTYISGGEGNDVISIHNATSLDTIGSVGTSDILDTIDGGNGSDALSLDTTVNDVFLNKIISGIETLKVTGKNDVTLAANIVPTIIDVDDAVTAIATAAGAAASAAAAKAVVAASSASAAIKAAVATDLTLTTAALVAAAVINAQKSVVTFNTGYTQATTVKLGAEDSVVNSANVNLTINTTAANMIYDGDITITGGTGTDTLNLTADNSTVVFNSIITNLDKVVIVDGGDVTSGTVTAGKTVSLDLGAYDTALTIDASALDAGTPNATTPANLDNDETLTVSGALATKALNITGGAGRDTITGGTLNDVINAGAGDDSINGTAGGNDRIDAGAGNDTINMGNQLTSADTIDGGAGNDTLIFTSPLLNSLTNISGIETLVASGIVSIPSSLSFNTIDLSYGSNNDTLTFAQGYLSTTTVLADSGDSVTNTANTTLNVNFTAADLVTVIGGTRVDTLTITADNGTVDIKNVTKFSGIDNIIIVDNNVAGKTVTLDLSNYATAIRIDASSLDAGTPNSITPSTLDNDETLTIVGTSNAPLTVTGGDGADTLIGSGSSNVGDSLVGGAGNDLFKMSTNLTYLDTIFGGDGSDKLETSGVVNDSQFKNIDGIENLTLTDTATLGAIFNKAFVSNSNISVASNKKVDATFTTSGYIFTASTTNDITGGSGNDTFSFAGVNQLTANDIINGTSGDDDTIRLDNSTGVVTAIIDLDKVTNMDNVTIFNGDGGNAATTQNINLTFDLVTLTTVQTIKVGAAVITDTHDALIMTNSAGSSTTTFNITGGAGNDVLMGSNGADTLTGGSGADTLTGGSGADIFRFDLLANISNAAGLNVDTISDFLTGTDKVNFGTAGSAMSATIKGIALQPGITTAATFAANIPDATAVNSISDVYAAILANVGFNSSNFLGSTNSVSGIIAKTITFATGTLAGQYLVVNDSAPGFAYADDIVIKVVGTIAANDLTFTV